MFIKFAAQFVASARGLAPLEWDLTGEAPVFMGQEIVGRSSSEFIDQEQRLSAKDFALYSLRAYFVEAHSVLTDKLGGYDSLSGARKAVLLCLYFIDKEALLADSLAKKLAGDDFVASSKAIKKAFKSAYKIDLLACQFKCDSVSSSLTCENCNATSDSNDGSQER